MKPGGSTIGPFALSEEFITELAKLPWHSNLNLSLGDAKVMALAKQLATNLNRLGHDYTPMQLIAVQYFFGEVVANELLLRGTSLARAAPKKTLTLARTPDTIH